MGRGWGAPGPPPTRARHQAGPSGNVPLRISPITTLLDMLHHFRSKTDCMAVNTTLLSDPQGEKCFRSFSEQLRKTSVWKAWFREDGAGGTRRGFPRVAVHAVSGQD